MPVEFMGRPLYCPECDSDQVRFMKITPNGMLFVCTSCGKEFLPLKPRPGKES